MAKPKFQEDIIADVSATDIVLQTKYKVITSHLIYCRPTLPIKKSVLKYLMPSLTISNSLNMSRF